MSDPLEPPEFMWLYCPACDEDYYVTEYAVTCPICCDTLTQQDGEPVEEEE